jgi:2-polyprenyl-6-methoxyphenol hydroxylase-like FAD-dependent oxidoreductase
VAVGRDLDLPTLAVVRGEFHRVLAESVQDTIRVGAAVEGWDDDGAGVTVQLSNGDSERFDVLVGADGLNSRVREGLLGQSAPAYAGYVTWLANAPVAHPAYDNTVRLSFGRGQRFIGYSLSGGRTHWEAIVRLSPGGTESPGGRKADMLEHSKTTNRRPRSRRRHRLLRRDRLRHRRRASGWRPASGRACGSERGRA